MNFAVKGVLALCWLFLVPAAAGIPFLQRKPDRTVIDCFLTGYLFLFAAAELLILPMIVLQTSLHTLVLIYSVVVLLAASAGLLCLWKSVASGSVPALAARLRTWLRSLSPVFLCALVLIAVQLCIVTVYAHFDADDAFFVSTAVTSVETDSIFAFNPYTGAPYGKLPRRYVLSPFPIFLAVISQLCGGLHPAITAHTIFPPVFLILSYIIVYQLGKKWFADPHRRGAFLFLAAVLNSFTYYSAYNAGNFTMIRLWQGKALLAGALLPLLFYLCLSIMLEEKRGYPRYLLLMANISCCLLSSMGIMLAPLMQGIFLILSFLRFRNLKKCIAELLCTIPSILLGLLYLTL